MLPGKYILPLVAPEDMDMQPPKGVLFMTLFAATDVRARATRPGGLAACLLTHICKAASKRPVAVALCQILLCQLPMAARLL